MGLLGSIVVGALIILQTVLFGRRWFKMSSCLRSLEELRLSVLWP